MKCVNDAAGEPVPAIPGALNPLQYGGSWWKPWLPSNGAVVIIKPLRDMIREFLLFVIWWLRSLPKGMAALLRIARRAALLRIARQAALLRIARRVALLRIKMVAKAIEMLIRIQVPVLVAGRGGPAMALPCSLLLRCRLRIGRWRAPFPGPGWLVTSPRWLAPGDGCRVARVRPAGLYVRPGMISPVPPVIEVVKVSAKSSEKAGVSSRCIVLRSTVVGARAPAGCVARARPAVARARPAGLCVRPGMISPIPPVIEVVKVSAKSSEKAGVSSRCVVLRSTVVGARVPAGCVARARPAVARARLAVARARPAGLCVRPGMISPITLVIEVVEVFAKSSEKVGVSSRCIVLRGTVARARAPAGCAIRV
ncbi:hypothetical protein B0T26DRAFT_523182 [Lasiosphaeria miniovina]|uniref:Uncharacterized protein n=1 Tax=Lasiosphaeria miniovina TaxID=1954250 RepID=A0AA39ZUS2_9PEZI|nr:uncharacterized protein B0T26DRAFT_523182 [Lasiosphaeria miniovina]KAK0704087.1 hypothetical protein B0T26DRAFT_523182 [Lasiosphaeria miniovina]